MAWTVGNSIIRSRLEQVKIPTWAPYNSQVLSLTHQLTTVSMMPLIVITFDLQLYEKDVKLQMHKAPDLDHLVFRIGEMHTIMASLRDLGA